MLTLVRNGDEANGNETVKRSPLDEIGPIAEWQKVLAAMRDSGVHGMTLGLGEPQFVTE